jgi:hypothetical protein
VIVDPDLGGDIVALAEVRPVWIVDSGVAPFDVRTYLYDTDD